MVVQVLSGVQDSPRPELQGKSRSRSTGDASGRIPVLQGIRFDVDNAAEHGRWLEGCGWNNPRVDWRTGSSTCSPCREVHRPNFAAGGTRRHSKGKGLVL